MAIRSFRGSPDLGSDSVTMPPDELLKRLADAQPSFLKDGQGIRGNPIKVLSGKTPTTSKYNFAITQPPPETTPFPTPSPSEAGGTQNPGGAAGSNVYGFQLDLDSIDQTAYTIDIHVRYGEINLEPPDGMTDADDYVFTIPGANDGEEIWAGIIFDIPTLSLTDRYLDHGLVIPNSTLVGTTGTLIVPIGFIDIQYGGGGSISVVTPRNRHCGDINIGFVYGAVNGSPGLFFLSQLDDPIQLPP